MRYQLCTIKEDGSLDKKLKKCKDPAEVMKAWGREIQKGKTPRYLFRAMIIASGRIVSISLL